MADDNKYLLVSDSNERSTQYDSRRLSIEDLALMAQDSLFKTELQEMSQYLTVNQFAIQKMGLEAALQQADAKFSSLDLSGVPKFRVVNGQVIFLDAEEFERFNQNKGGGWTPLDMVRKNWDITQDYRLEQVSDCILRGVTKVERSETQKPSNITAPLTDENMPAHMHNSGITQGASMEGLKSDDAAKVGSAKGTTVDLFDNDSFSTGVDCNELEGVVDEFSVVRQGNDSIQHDNLPKVKRYYTFVVTQVS